MELRGVVLSILFGSLMVLALTGLAANFSTYFPDVSINNSNIENTLASYQDIQNITENTRTQVAGAEVDNENSLVTLGKQAYAAGKIFLLSIPLFAGLVSSISALLQLPYYVGQIFITAFILMVVVLLVNYLARGKGI